jgi:hypothetical protein
MPGLREEIKSFKYLETLYKCCSGDGPITYDKCVAKGEAEKALIESFFDVSSYKGKPATAKQGALPAPFLAAIIHDLQMFEKCDPYRISGVTGQALDTALEGLIWKDDGNEDNDQEGGGLNKIITLSKKEQSSFVPYKVYQLAGSYTEEYLQKMNSKIRRLDSQFGGFRKVTKEITGSIEELDTLLRTDLEHQMRSSLNKRYYKKYNSQKGGGGNGVVHRLWDAYKASSQEEKNVFESFAWFMAKEIPKPPVPQSAVSSKEEGGAGADEQDSAPYVHVTGGDLNGKKVRINMTKGRNATTTEHGKKIPLLLEWLPELNSLSNLAKTWWVVKGDRSGLLSMAESAGVNGEAIANAKSLDEVFSCDGRQLDKIKSSEFNTTDVSYDFSTDFDTHNAIRQNNWKLGPDGAFQRKRSDGTFETFDPSDPKYREYFRSANKCFNSYLDIDNDKCCEVIDKLIEGNGEDFMKQIVNEDITINALDKAFDKQNPYTIRQVLRSFKFPEIAVWDPFVKGKLKKFPNFTYWVKNVLPSESSLSPDDRKKLATNAPLKDVLNMCVSFINHNVQILNPNVQPFQGTNMESKVLSDRNVLRYTVNPDPKPEISWNSSIKQIMRAASRNQLTNSLYSSPFIASGLQFGVPSMMGGNSDPKKGVVLQETEVVPQFATTIANDIKVLLQNLRSANKVLKSSEMEKINKELNDFQKLEIELYRKILTINKYIKIAYLMNDDNNEYVSLDKIRQQIANYTDLFSEYSSKDLELKNIGSFLRQYTQDKL